MSKKSPVIELDEDHIYTVDGVVVPGVTDALQSVGFIDSWWFSEDATKRGTHVHTATEYYDKGDLDMDSVWPDYLPYVEAYIKFKKDTGFEPLEIEKRFYNERWNYAGTLDRIGRLAGIIALIDIKTGAHAFWWPIQLAGYALGVRVEYPKLARYSLRLRSDGTYTLSPPYIELYDFDIFKSVMTIHQYKVGAGIV